MDALGVNIYLVSQIVIVLLYNQTIFYRLFIVLRLPQKWPFGETVDP